MAQSEWAKETVERIAKAIRDVRGDRSTQWLADRTAELGHPISRVAISNFEVGRKSGLEVTDLIVLAEALNVPPLQLIYPDLPDGEVEVLPNRVESCIEAAQWFEGAAIGSQIARSRQYETLRREVEDFERRLGEMATNLENDPNAESDFIQYLAAVSSLRARAADMKADMLERGWPVNE